MNCIEFRRQIGSEPQTLSQELLAHGRECSTCARFLDGTRSMDGVLARAMRIDVPARLGDPAALLASVQEGRQGSALARGAWFALAASVLVGIAFATGLWTGRDRQPLAAELVAHVLHEPGSLRDGLPVLEYARVADVLDHGRVSLKGDIGDVRYAGLCIFRGNAVPHLVIAGASGPVTIMLLPEETVAERTPFDEEGFTGVIVPAGRGSIAIIGNPDELLEPVQEKFSQSVEFSI